MLSVIFPVYLEKKIGWLISEHHGKYGLCFSNRAENEIRMWIPNFVEIRLAVLEMIWKGKVNDEEDDIIVYSCSEINAKERLKM